MSEVKQIREVRIVKATFAHARPLGGGASARRIARADLLERLTPRRSKLVAPPAKLAG